VPAIIAAQRIERVAILDAMIQGRAIRRQMGDDVGGSRGSGAKGVNTA
jgi:hypothetical protein